MKHWICSQIGAREHFAIPRALHAAGRLREVFTDFPRPGLEHIDRSLVNTFPIGGMRWWWRLRNAPSYETFIDQGRWFSDCVVKKLDSLPVEGTTFFGYDTGFLEAAEALKKRGARCILGQIDPGRIESEIVEEERERWPGWETAPPVPEAYHAHREKEWEIADRIIVNSPWSREALVRQGVSEEKLQVIPLCYEPSTPYEPAPPKTPSEPLVVLWLGQVNLRKGIPYLIEAARMLPPERVRITVAGPIHINRSILSDLPAQIRFVGPVRRTRVTELYRKADVFILPTLSDGFAITQLEAMAHGLPVIATPNCGEVVDHGTNGFIVPPRDPKEIANRVLELAEDHEQYDRLSREALTTASRFPLKRLATELVSVEG